MRTKNILMLVIIFALSVFSIRAEAQKPEKVYSLVKVDKPFDWYITQAALWKKVIDAEPANAAAWVSFYTANRMAHITDDEAWKAKKGPGFMELNAIVAAMKNAVPGTYDYYHVKVWNDGYQSDENAADLFKAYNLAPDRPDVYSSLVNYYELKRDRQNEKVICTKWFESNDLSPNILNYNYNVLQSVDDNGIIITNGDNDTYPLWILQYALGIKRQVMVVNINLVTLDDYRKRLFEENRIAADDFRALEEPSQEKIINHLIRNSGRPVYFANTLLTSYYETYKKDLYLVGLAFKYSADSFDNVAVMQNNVESKFLLDYLKVSFSNDMSQAISDRMSMGYLPALIKLHEHYLLAGEIEKATDIKKTGVNIAAKGDPEIKAGELFSTR